MIQARIKEDHARHGEWVIPVHYFERDLGPMLGRSWYCLALFRYGSPDKPIEIPLSWLEAWGVSR